MNEIEVECAPTAGGWLASVKVTGRGGTTEHKVSVSAAELARFDPDAAEPGPLVRRSFEFLLEREPRESIMRAFDLTVIGRYFPEYESEIRRR